MRITLTPTLFLAAASLLAIPLVTSAAEPDPVATAEEAVKLRYLGESIAYDKKRTEQRRNGANRNIESAKKNLPKLEEEYKAEKTKYETAKAELDKMEKAAASGDEAAVKAAADAKRNLGPIEGKFRQAERRFENTRDGIKRNEELIKTADREIPEKETLAQETLARAEKLRLKANDAQQAHATKQNPLEVARKIDAIIDGRLEAEGIPASPQTDDAEFLRRVTLDLTGVTPTYEEALAFLGSDDPDKRTQLIETLLANDGYGRHFAQCFSTPTIENSVSTLNQSRDYFKDWLALSLNLNRRWDKVTADMVAGEGAGAENPGTLFVQAYGMNAQPDPSLLLAAVGDQFLGVQIKCAQCHDHPFEDWVMEDFWTMNAMMGRVRLKGRFQNGQELEHIVTDADLTKEEMVRMNGIEYPAQMPDGKIDIPDPLDVTKTIRTVQAGFIDGSKPQLEGTGNFRRDFVKWLVAKENPHFARTTTNRLWAHFFARGIVEDIENLHPDHKPSHPEILDLLEKEFKDSGYDLKYLIRCIVGTSAYARTSRPVDGNRDDGVLLSHMAVKPLVSYTLVDSIKSTIGHSPLNGSRRTDAAGDFDTRLPGGDPKVYTHSIPQVLKLLNSREHADNPALGKATQGKEPPEAIEHLFIAVLSRRPSEQEAADMLAFYESVGDARAAYSDIFWVLINCSEYLVNH